MEAQMDKPEVSVVIPVYNEVDNVGPLADDPPPLRAIGPRILLIGR